VAASYDDDIPYTPAWQEAITGVKRADVISVARQFAENAHKTQGKSMVIIGAGSTTGSIWTCRTARSSTC
jgi:nitrate reductase alpha subunit